MKNAVKLFEAMHSIAIIAIAAIIGLALAACDTSNGNDTTHSHQWGAWKSNATQHWKECSCGEEYGRANHNGNPCPVCEYNDSSHSHSYSDTWSKDATQHWKECSCGDKRNVTNHTGNPCVCGYDNGSTIAEPTVAGLYRKTKDAYILIDTITPTDIDAVITYVNANADEGEYLLVVGQNITLTPAVLKTSLPGYYERSLARDNARLTIIGTGSMRTISLDSTKQGRMFTIGGEKQNPNDYSYHDNDNVSLTIGNNITLKGRTGNNNQVVYVQFGANFTMQGNSIITGNNGNNDNGSSVNNRGVYISRGNNSDSTFLMKDNASITDNAGGVTVSRNGSVFTMQDNTIISNNKAKGLGGGGVLVTEGGVFTMKDNAAITNNEITNSSNGGGVSVDEGSTFTMISGTISGNKAVEWDGGGVSVRSDSTFTMQGGIISNNEARAGGGVYHSSETIFTMQNNAVISGNRTTHTGGGVHFTTGVFLMKDNAAITGNIASDTTQGSGGGVCVLSGAFTMQDNAVISGNESKNITGGGGVYISNSSFYMNGGVISGNKAVGVNNTIVGILGGGGVAIIGSTFRISNGIVYGSGVGNNSNTSTYGGAALSNENGNAQYGSGENWTDIPLTSGARNTTINVVNGELQ